MHVLDIDLEVGNGPHNGLDLYFFTVFHAINRAIACSLICNQNLTCIKGTKLDYYDVIPATSNFDMAIIMLGRLFFMLSYWLAPTDAPSIQHERCVGSDATGTLVRSHLLSRVDFEAL
jgi:hypothetical protein